MNLQSYIRLLRLTQVLLLALCMPAAGLAATVLAQQAHDPLTLDAKLIVFSILVATAGALASVLLRLNIMVAAEAAKPLEERRPLVQPWLFIAANLVGSYVAGLAGFMMGRANQWEVWNSMFVILILSFMGAKALDIIGEKLLSVDRFKG